MNATSKNTTTYDSILAANYLLSIANSKGKILNVTQVQKMLYIVYGFFFAKKGRIIFDESPKAWPYGPVFPKTRKSKVKYGDIIKLDDSQYEEIALDTDLTEVMNKVVEIYSKYSASKLSKWSHKKDGPWYKTTKSENFNWNLPIPNEYIQEYFSKITVF